MNGAKVSARCCCCLINKLIVILETKFSSREALSAGTRGCERRRSVWREGRPVNGDKHVGVVHKHTHTHTIWNTHARIKVCAPQRRKWVLENRRKFRRQIQEWAGIFAAAVACRRVWGVGIKWSVLDKRIETNWFDTAALGSVITRIARNGQPEQIHSGRVVSVRSS